MHLLAHRPRRVLDVAADVAPLHVHVHVGHELGILGADRGRPPGEADTRHLTQRHHGAARRRHEHLLRDGPRIVAEIARVADDDAVALAALHGRGHRLAAQGRRDHLLHVADREAVAGDSVAVRRDLQVVPALQPLGEGARRAGHLADGLLDLGGQGRERDEVRAEHLDADGGADARGQHVDARADGLRPGVGDAGQAQRLVHLRAELVQRHPCRPFLLRLEIDHGLGHLGGGCVRRRRGAAGLAEDGRHLREALDDAVLHLQQLGGLGDGQARRRHRHVEQRALVQVGDAAPLGRAELHARHVAQQHRRAVRPGLEHDALQVAGALQVAAAADHVLGLGQLDGAAAHILVAGLHRLADTRERDAVGLQLAGVHDDLVLALEPADGGDLRHAGRLGELEADQPVLQAPQLGQQGNRLRTVGLPAERDV
jgi:hypothetical protein